MGKGNSGRTCGKTDNLQRKGAQMPLYGPQVVRRDLYKLEEKKNGYEPPLP